MLSQGTNHMNGRSTNVRKEVIMNQLEAIYLEVQPKMYAFFYARTLNHSVSEDLTQDVIYAAMKGIGRFAGDSTIETWLYSIAQNHLKKYYRSKRYRKNLEENVKGNYQSSSKSPEELFLINEEKSLLLDCIQTFDDLPKEIVSLRIFAELSFKEIGQLVSKSENYVRVTFHRTKVKLQQEMEARK